MMSEEKNTAESPENQQAAPTPAPAEQQPASVAPPVTPIPPVQSGAWICSRCGQGGNTGRFCVSCGQPRDGAPQFMQQPQPMQTGVQRPQPRILPRRPNVQRMQGPQPNYGVPAPSRGTNQMMPLLVGVIVLLVAALGFFAWREFSPAPTSSGHYESLAKQDQDKPADTGAKEQTQQQAPQPQTQQQVPQQPQADVQGATAALCTYYEDIGNHRMRDAYSKLSSDMQNQMGTYETFSNSYHTTVSNQVSKVSIVEVPDAQHVVLSYTLTSRDNINGSLKTQVFHGRATLSSQTGSWHIVDMKVTK